MPFDLRTFFILGVICGTWVLVGAGCIPFSNNEYSTPVMPAPEKPVEPVRPEPVERDGRILYGTDMSEENVRNAREDCEERGGELNSCGSSCEPGQMCMAVCELICELE